MPLRHHPREIGSKPVERGNRGVTSDYEGGEPSPGLDLPQDLVLDESQRLRYTTSSDDPVERAAQINALVDDDTDNEVMPEEERLPRHYRRTHDPRTADLNTKVRDRDASPMERVGSGEIVDNRGVTEYAVNAVLKNR